MRKMVEQVLCDRCGREIQGCSVRMSLHYSGGEADSGLMEGRNELPLWVERMLNKDFCEECAEMIADFALNKDTCDECVKEMEEERRMLQDHGGEE